MRKWFVSCNLLDEGYAAATIQAQALSGYAETARVGTASAHPVSLRHGLLVDAEMGVSVAIPKGEIDANHVDERQEDSQPGTCTRDDAVRELIGPVPGCTGVAEHGESEPGIQAHAEYSKRPRFHSVVAVFQ